MRYLNAVLKYKHLSNVIVPLLLFLISVYITDYDLKLQVFNFIEIIFVVIILINCFYIFRKHQKSYNLSAIYIFFFIISLSVVVWTVMVYTNNQYLKTVLFYISLIIFLLVNIAFAQYILGLLLLKKIEAKRIFINFGLTLIVLVLLFLILKNHTINPNYTLTSEFIQITSLIFTEIMIFSMIYSRSIWLNQLLLGMTCTISIMFVTAFYHPFFTPEISLNILLSASSIGKLFIMYSSFTLKNTENLTYPLNLEKNFYNTLMIKMHVSFIVALTILVGYVKMRNLASESFFAYSFFLIFILFIGQFMFANKIFYQVNLEINEIIRYFSSKKNYNTSFQISEFNKLALSFANLLDQMEYVEKEKTILTENILQNKLAYMQEQHKLDELLIKKKWLERLSRQNTKFRDKLALLVHDIKSPTLTIHNVIKHLKNFQKFDNTDIEALYIANNKIEFMVQQLLKEYNQVNHELNKVYFSVFLVLDKVFRESQIIYRHIQFYFSVEHNLYLQLIYGNINDFERVINNILKNACEAIPEQTNGEIRISLLLKDGQICIMVTDNGIGMTDEIKKKLLIGNFEGSTKVNGSGAGFKQICHGIKELNAVYDIVSSPNQGTSIVIKISQLKKPFWIINEINLNDIKTIIVMDDDVAMFRQWENKFVNIVDFFQIKFFENVIDLKNYVKNIDNLDNVLLLCDYQLKDTDGIEVITQLKIRHSILVTNLAESQKIQELVQNHNIHLLNKAIIPHIQVRYGENKNIEDLFKNTDMIWLDDQVVFPRYIVKKYYSHLSVEIFDNVDEFFSTIHLFNRSSLIILDYELSNQTGNIKTNGIEIAQSLYNMGFFRIIILSAESIEDVPQYIKALVKFDHDNLIRMNKII